MLTCKQASQLISQSLDRPLSWYELMRLRLHLILCDACKRFRQQLYLLRHSLHKLTSSTENDSTIHLPADAKARILNKLDSQSQ